MMDKETKAALVDGVGEAIKTEGGNPVLRFAALLELRELKNEASIEPRRAIFLRMSTAVAHGYAGMSDQQIAAAAETPELMRFFIDALEKFQSHDDDGQTSAHGWNGYLANAFGLTGKKGGDHQSKWPQWRQLKALAAYNDKIPEELFDDDIEAVVKVDETKAEREELEERAQRRREERTQRRQDALEKGRKEGILAAYDAVFGSDNKDGRKDEKIKENWNSLRNVLIEHGYIRPDEFQRKSK